MANNFNKIKSDRELSKHQENIVTGHTRQRQVVQNVLMLCTKTPPHLLQLRIKTAKGFTKYNPFFAIYFTWLFFSTFYTYRLLHFISGVKKSPLSFADNENVKTVGQQCPEFISYASLIQQKENHWFKANLVGLVLGPRSSLRGWGRFSGKKNWYWGGLFSQNTFVGIG